MGRIKVLKSTELVNNNINDDIYPVTSTQAVYDENNIKLSNILKSINISISAVDNKISNVLNKLIESSKEKEIKPIVGRAISCRAKFGDIYFSRTGVLQIKESELVLGDDGNIIENNYILTSNLARVTTKFEIGFPFLFIIPENWVDIYNRFSIAGFDENSEIYQNEILPLCINASQLCCSTRSPYVTIKYGELVIDKPIPDHVKNYNIFCDDTYNINIQNIKLYKLKKSKGRKKTCRTRWCLNYSGKYRTSFNPKDPHIQSLLQISKYPVRNFGLYKAVPLWRGRKSINEFKFIVRVQFRQTGVGIDKTPRIATGIRCFRYDI